MKADPPAAGADGHGAPPPDFRLPAATRLGRVRLQVAALARSLAFYQGVLGLRVLHRSGGAATLGVEGDEAPLVELREHANAAPAPHRGRLGLYHFAILLPDRAALGRFAGHLAALRVPAGASDHRVSEAFYLHDPDGLGIEVYADRPRAAWRYDGGQLVMDTQPLDVAGLVRAAAGEPWRRMPAGATVGHLHLRVGDLDRAAAFYHTGLGCDRTVWSYPGALFLAAGGYHHHLGLNTWAGPGAEPPRPGDARLLEWELVVPAAADVERAAGRLGASGYPVARDAPGWLATDPWGTAVRLRACDDAG